MLEALGCYSRRESFIRELAPEYGPGWLSKIVIANSLTTDGYNLSSLVVRNPEGEQKTLRMPIRVYQGIVAATNMKQRTRKQIEYYHADRLNYAVVGTPNRLEYDQGFFVKNGDGSADVKPIAHLYKSQVYQLAEYLGVPEEIRRRPPTTDTYSLPQTQENSTSLFPTTVWISAFTNSTTLCLRKKWPPRHSSPKSKSIACGPISPLSARLRDISISRLGWLKRLRKLRPGELRSCLALKPLTELAAPARTRAGAATKKIAFPSSDLKSRGVHE